MVLPLALSLERAASRPPASSPADAHGLLRRPARVPACHEAGALGTPSRPRIASTMRASAAMVPFDRSITNATPLPAPRLFAEETTSLSASARSVFLRTRTLCDAAGASGAAAAFGRAKPAASARRTASERDRVERTAASPGEQDPPTL